jgi:hypothetical protein
MWASPEPVKLNGKMYQFTPLSIEDFEELDKYVRWRYLSIVRESLDDSWPTQLRDSIIAASVSHIVGMTWLTGHGARLIASLDGMTKVAHLSLSKKDPSLTFEGLKDILRSNPENIREISRALKESTKNFRTAQGGAGQGPEPTTGRSSRSSSKGSRGTRQKKSAG